MIVRFGLLTRHQDMDVEAFRNYWRGQHAEVVKSAVPGLIGYLQNHVVDRTQRGIDFKRGSYEVDGLSQLFFRSIGDLKHDITDDAVRALQADERNFIGQISILTALQNVVVTPPRHGPFVKRMSFLRKRDDISMEEFQDEWFNMHSVLVKRLPGLLGYRQNIVLERQQNRLSDAGSETDISIDGVVELWFENTVAIEAAFRSRRGITTMTHAQEFISEISTYMVEVHEVIPEPAV